MFWKTAKECHYWAVIVTIAILLITSSVRAEDHLLKLSDGHIELTVPESWQARKPRVRIIDYEYLIPREKGDPADGRITFMSVGGSVKANLDRWRGQFTKLNGNSETQTSTIADQKVHLLDLTGTYKDQRGPFAPAKMRANYRMLAAMIETEKYGLVSIKLYGPSGNIEKNAAGFKKMLSSLTVK